MQYYSLELFLPLKYKMRWLLVLLILVSAYSCRPLEPNEKKRLGAISYPKETHPDDAHSFAKPEVRTQHLDLELEIDFENKKINGIAKHTLERTAEKTSFFIVDMDELEIKNVVDQDGRKLSFSIGEDLPFIGSPLVIDIDDAVSQVVISYSTSKDAAALGWLDSFQTISNQPFLYTQGEAILTRSWIPLQDGPGLKITWSANVKAPPQYLALMSGSNPTHKSKDGAYSFKMEQPVAPYLIALAVGDLRFQSISDDVGVYSEPQILKEAVAEFAQLPNMVEVAEELYGEYRWGRYDVLVLPAAFPFGGMENPLLTFATPTIIAGDSSLVSLLAHELAHSWSGNLVTNTSWDDFWLNEGFTVFLERRIVEELEGKEYADMLAELGYHELQLTLTDLEQRPELTMLKLNLESHDPDLGMTDVAYEKGYLFLKALQKEVGVEEFDNFLKQYFNDHAYKNLTTKQFKVYAEEHLPKAAIAKVDIYEWFYKPGLPSGAPIVQSARLKAAEQAAASIGKTGSIRLLPVSRWSSHELVHFLRNLPDDITKEQLALLDSSYSFTNSGNSEVKFAWFIKAIERGYQPVLQNVDNFLGQVGRRKFVLPLYKALKEEYPQQAANIYQKYRSRYHEITRRSVDEALGYNSKG